MGFGSSMPNQTKILIEFRKYEIELYNYFFGIPDTKEDITFYFISKEYIFDFLKKFNFSEFSNDLNNILIYKANSEDPYDKIIANDLIMLPHKHRRAFPGFFQQSLSHGPRFHFRFPFLRKIQIFLRRDLI